MVDSNSFSEAGSGRAAKRRSVVLLLGLLILAAAFLFLLARPGPTPPPPSVTVLARWTSNNEQFVTLRIDPTNAMMTFCDLVSDTYDASHRPKLTRVGYASPFPVHEADNPAVNMRVVSSPFRGTGVPFTPGSYTVAAATTNTSPRVRLGVAQRLNGPADFAGRLRNCYYARSLAPLRWKSFCDPAFIVLDSVTNFPAPSR